MRLNTRLVGLGGRGGGSGEKEGEGCGVGLRTPFADSGTGGGTPREKEDNGSVEEGPDVTNKMLPGFLVVFFREGVLLSLFREILAFFIRGETSAVALSLDGFLLLFFLVGLSFSFPSVCVGREPSPPSRSSSFLFISTLVPTATISEIHFSNPFTVHIAPGVISSGGEEILMMGTIESESSSGHRIKQKVAIRM